MILGDRGSIPSKGSLIFSFGSSEKFVQMTLSSKLIIITYVNCCYFSILKFNKNKESCFPNMSFEPGTSYTPVQFSIA
jgi:hypothetical protein